VLEQAQGPSWRRPALDQKINVNTAECGPQVGAYKPRRAGEPYATNTFALIERNGRGSPASSSGQMANRTFTKDDAIAGA